MTDSYIKQVTPEMQEAVYLWLCIRANKHVDIDIGELCGLVLASVPKPEPVAWGNIAPKFRENNRVIFTDKVVAEDYNENCYPLAPLYTHAPDAQAEIDQLHETIRQLREEYRLGSKVCFKFISKFNTLRIDRHHELVKAARIARNEDLEDEAVAYIVEQERGNVD